MKETVKAVVSAALLKHKRLITSDYKKKKSSDQDLDSVNNARSALADSRGKLLIHLTYQGYSEQSGAFQYPHIQHNN